MNTNIEFLGSEPIENVITCMKYKMDKTIFFGYTETIDKMKKQTERFLKKYCLVKEVVFIPVSQKNLQSVIQSIREVVEKERIEGNNVFFDITGGESLILVAFGMLSEELMMPMHMFDVKKDKIIELNSCGDKSISIDVESHKLELDIDKFIEMQGGIINYQMHKNIKEINTAEWEQKMQRMWEVSRKYDLYWNTFSGFLRKVFRPDESLKVYVRTEEVIDALENGNNKLFSADKIDKILDELRDIGVIHSLVHRDGTYSFSYESMIARDMLWDSGSILELHTFLDESKTADDCKVGVHIDWDGEIHEFPGRDVVNEIDILVLKGNIPTFISCKNGKMESNQALHALYELDMVATRFGGKYAKKKLVITKFMPAIYRTRAQEMSIEVNFEGY